jgi:hypothetical protein
MQPASGATGKPLHHEDTVLSASFSPHGARVVTVSGNAARLWKAPPVAPPNIVATAYKMLGDHETAGLSTCYGIDVKEPICMRDAPAAGLG